MRLKKHIRVVHNNERKFVCPTCKKCFGERGYVLHHVTRFSGQSLTIVQIYARLLRPNAFDLLSWTCFYRISVFLKGYVTHVRLLR